MPINCLGQESIRKLQPHLGDFNIEKMFDMTTKERFSLFSKYLVDEEAYFVNRQFEKAMISAQNNALEKWVTETFIGQEKKKVKGVLDRINEINQLLGENDGRFIESLISQKMGLDVTAEEFEKINGLAQELQSLAAEESRFGTPTIEYWQKREEMNNYIKSITPTHKLKVATSTIGRGLMLTSIKSPITNIVGNSTLAVSESLSKRLTDNRYTGLNNEYAMQFFKFNNKVFQKSGYDLTRMYSINEDQKRLGEHITHAQGEGMTRRLGRFVEDIVFKQLMGAPDVAFSSAHFVDSANLSSTKMAYEEGYIVKSAAKERALEIFKDATRIDPQTTEGRIVREKAIADAHMGTYTDNTFISTLSLKLRQVLNDMSGDFSAGDLLVPFVKTPANVIARSIESSGVTLPYDIPMLVRGIAKKDANQIRTSLNKMARAGIGLTGAFILINLLDPDDYIGEYSFTSPKERELVELRKATYNSIKFGDKWVSMDYFGPFAGPLVGMMNARKYGKGVFESLFKYYQGVITQLTKIPGIDEVGRIFTSQDEIKKEPAEMAKDLSIYTIDFFASRTLPAIASDLAKAIDEYERDVKYGTIEGSLENIERKIPGLSDNLEPRMNLFSEKVETESPFATLMFGARYKKGTGEDDIVINELVRLSQAGTLPSLTDVRRSSQRMKDLLDKIGREAWTETFVYFGNEWKNDIKNEIQKESYKKLSNEEKSLKINQLKDDALVKAINKYSRRSRRKTNE